jgi:hypothetical protein
MHGDKFIALVFLIISEFNMLKPNCNMFILAIGVILNFGFGRQSDSSEIVR